MTATLGRSGNKHEHSQFRHDDCLFFYRTLACWACCRDDVDFFTHMEMYMRQEKPTLCGRDHISYRSYYLPAKVSATLQS